MISNFLKAQSQILWFEIHLKSMIVSKLLSPAAPDLTTNQKYSRSSRIKFLCTIHLWRHNLERQAKIGVDLWRHYPSRAGTAVWFANSFLDESPLAYLENVQFWIFKKKIGGKKLKEVKLGQSQIFWEELSSPKPDLLWRIIVAKTQIFLNYLWEATFIWCWKVKNTSSC